jgi:tetratricopeptide (TPR) repeat protein
LTTLGKLLEEIGDVAASLVCFREAEALLDGRDAAEARAERVRLAELAGEWDELAELLEQDARGLSPAARVPILEKLATMHRGLRADPSRATEALLSLLSIVGEDRRTGLHRDLAVTLESAGSGSDALSRARDYARSASPELRTAVFRILGRLHDAWGENGPATEAWDLVREGQPNDEEALGRSVDLAIADERFSAALDLLEHWVRNKTGIAAVALHLRIAELAEEHLKNLDRAADALTTALEFSPDDRSVATSAADVLRRAKRFGEEKIVLKVLLSSAPDAASRRAHQERLARLAANELQDPDEALRVWTQLASDTKDIASLGKLRDDARSEGDAARLDVILARLATVETEPRLRSEHALERAKLLAEELRRPQMALKVLAHAVASYGESHLPSLEYLEELSQGAGDRRMLARALEGQVDLVPKSEKRFLLKRLSELYAGPLSENTGLVHALNRWEASSPDEADPILRLLPVLAARGDWAGLLERLDKLISISRTDTQKWIDVVAEAVTSHAKVGGDAAEKMKLDNACAWFLVEVAGKAKAPAQRLRLMVGAADRFESARGFEEAFTATTRALEMAGARPELLDRMERVADKASAVSKLDALYGRLVVDAPTEEDAVYLALRHAAYLDKKGLSNEAVDRLLRVSANTPTNDALLAELERLAPKSERLEEVLSTYVDRGNLLGGERAVRLLCRGAAVAFRSDAPQSLEKMVREAVVQAGDDEALVDFVEAAVEKLGRQGTEQLVRVYEAYGNDPSAPKIARARALVRAALRMRDQLGLQEVAFGVLQGALALAPTDPRVLDAIEDSAVERSLVPHLDQHLEKMVEASTDRVEAAALIARQAKLYQEHLGRPDDAVEAYLRSISMNPDDEWVLRRLRFCLIETGRVQELIGLLERRLSRVVDDAARVRQLRQLAKLWETEANNNWEAVDTWKRLLAIAPDDPEAIEMVSHLEKVSRVPVAAKPEPVPDETTVDDAPTLAVAEETADTDERTAPPQRPEEPTSRSVRPLEMVPEEAEVTSVSGPPIPPIPPLPRRSAKPPPVPAKKKKTPRRSGLDLAPKDDTDAMLDAETTERKLPPGIAEAETAEKKAPPPIAEAQTAEIQLPPPSATPTKDGDLPSIIVDPGLLEDE